MSPFNLADYEPVEDRLRAFWEEHPDGRVSTKLEHVGPDGYIVFAAVWRDVNEPQPAATGLAQEAVTERGVNSTSALENCETSAIGRALANLGYAAKGKRPSREEMTKANVSPEALNPGEQPSAGRTSGKGLPADGGTSDADAASTELEGNLTRGEASEDERAGALSPRSEGASARSSHVHADDPERTAKARKGFAVCSCGTARPIAEGWAVSV